MYLEAEYRIEMLNLIRNEKFLHVLPKALKNNKVDMWVHVIRRGSNDPLGIDLGGSGGTFIFYMNETGTIEKAAFDIEFSQISSEDFYDVIGERSDIGHYIRSKSPNKIALNQSRLLTHCDSLSNNDYMELVGKTGPEISKRFVSSEDVITEFRSRRVMSEIVLMGKLCEAQRRVMERTYRNIEPGRTTTKELGFYGQSELLKDGYSVNEYSVESPYIVHSSHSNAEELDNENCIIQPGDFIVWDWGTERTHMNFGTDFKRHVYVLKEDEYHMPEGLKNAWDLGVKARNILRRTIKSGRTSAETLTEIVKAIEKAGFTYTPFTDTEEDRKYLEQLGNSDKVGFSIDCHCVGNSGNSEVAVGPSMAPFRPERGRFMIHPNTLIAFEFVVLVWVPEWNKRIMLNLEDNALVTPRGVEAIYPFSEGIMTVK